MPSDLDRAAQLLRSAQRAVALTGAGISVASGIPDFRSPGGLWERWNPAEYATMTAFRARPEAVWRMFRDLRDACSQASPNPAHHALARLEREGPVQAVLTQNVDGLHEAAGSTVVALHGRGDRVRCPDCDRTDAWPPDHDTIPTCADCGSIVKVDAVLFEELLRFDVLREAERLAAGCDVMLVVGTSAEVYPAAGLPEAALRAGAALIEVNPRSTALSRSALRLSGQAEEILPQLAAAVL